MKRRMAVRLLVGGGLLALATGALFAQGLPRRGSRASQPQAPRPVFGEEAKDIFFEHVPDHLGPGGPPKRVASDPSDTMPATPAIDKPASTTVQGTWNQFISAEVLEDEIKKRVPELEEHVRTPSSFKSGGFQVARDGFSELAVLFGVIAEYPESVRWQDSAAGMRNALSQVARNCKVSSDAAFKEAQLRVEDLNILVRGGNVSLAADDAPVVWSEVADRRPLMVRMEKALHGRLDVWSANADQVKAQSDDLLHEAQLLSLLADIIRRPDYEYSDDEQYAQYAGALQAHCRELIGAVEQQNAAAAREAVGAIGQSCDACHADYRG